MATHSLGFAAATLLGLLAAIYAASCFVPTTTGRGTPALRASVAASERSSTLGSNSAWAAAAAAASVLVGAAVARRSAASTTAMKAVVRRELAVAYEESGIELLDNGKFAQGLIGSEGAWGPYEFDPVGFTKWTELMPWMREAELKHGRICMLAWLGLVVPDFVRVPGEMYSFEAVPVTIDAHDALDYAINLQFFIWIGITELCCSKKVFEWNSLEVAGDYGLGLQFLPKDLEGQKRKRLAELKNGRLAMIAFGGAVTQAALTRHPFPWLF